MQQLSCSYFAGEKGRMPAKVFIDSLDPRSVAKFFYIKALLEEFGHRLPQPHAKYIGDEIFELRFMGIEGSLRVLYFFYSKQDVIFTNGFIKKSNKTPVKEKKLAIQRRKIFFEEQKRGRA